jgi:hypothetical protein
VRNDRRRAAANFNWPEYEDLWIPMSIKPEEAQAREDHLLSSHGPAEARGHPEAGRSRGRDDLLRAS